jgi:xanthine dehydrogenase accessory factor
MSRSLIETAFQLTQAEKPFVLATVVWCERPTSAKPGSQAIIYSDGQITGWVGGSCTQPIVIREAKRMLREGSDPLLVRLGSARFSGETSGVRVFPMTCASEGSLEVYMEPHLPQPQLLLIGDSPIIIALKQLAPVLDFHVTHLDSADLTPAEINERTYILVATHGQYDEDALAQALVSPAAYVGLVSSPKRAQTCRVYLREGGMAEESVMRLKAPAGLDIGAVTPEEIATSIIAELIQVRQRMKPHEKVESAEVQVPVVAEQPEVRADEITAIDLVCGMTVEIATARQKLTHDGREFYFCCPACKREFARSPEQFLVAQG